MDNVDVTLDSVAHVDDDSKSRVAAETERGSQDRALALDGRYSSEIGVTARFARALMQDPPTGDVMTDIAELRSDVNWLLSLLFIVTTAFLMLLFLRR